MIHRAIKNGPWQIKIISMIITGIILLSTSLSYSTDTITLNTYYPSPFGAYDRIRLAARASLTGACEPGTLYLDKTTSLLKLCYDDGAGNGSWDSATNLTDLGDVSLDGRVDVKDAHYILQYIVGKRTFNNQQMWRGDVTQNGTISSLDSSRISQFMSGAAAWPTPPSSRMEYYYSNATTDVDNPALTITGSFAKFTGFIMSIAPYTFSSGPPFTTHLSDTVLTTAGAGTRLIWYPKKSAFRAGYVDGDQWDDVNIGDRSVAMGYSTKAGDYSLALGYKSVASSFSTSIGDSNNITSGGGIAIGKNNTVGNNAVVLGSDNNAGTSSMVIGSQNITTGSASIAIGSFNQPSGNDSIAIGWETKPLANHAITFGYRTQSDGIYSLSSGYQSRAWKPYSIALGWTTNTNGDYSVGLGEGNGSLTGNSSVGIGLIGGPSGNRAFASGSNVGAGDESFSTGSGGCSGSSNICLGHLFSTTGSNQTAIGRYITVQGNNSFGISISTPSPNIILAANNTMAIMGGNVGIGTTNPQFTLEVSGVAANAAVFSSLGGNWAAPSDKKLKKNIKPLHGALEKIIKLQGVTFEWIHPEDEGNLMGEQMGFIAQDVEQIFPEWVGTKNTGYKYLSIRGLEGLMIETVKELNQEIEALEKTNQESRKIVEQRQQRINEQQKEIEMLKSHYNKVSLKRNK